MNHLWSNFGLKFLKKWSFTNDLYIDRFAIRAIREQIMIHTGIDLRFERIICERIQNFSKTETEKKSFANVSYTNQFAIRTNPKFF